MRAWLRRQPRSVWAGLVLVLMAAAFLGGMAMKSAAAGPEDEYAGCGAGVPEWAQQSAEACAAFESAATGDAPADAAWQREQQSEAQDRLQRMQQQERARQQQHQDNYNCQVGPMFCPR
jgi:hypothetical protein